MHVFADVANFQPNLDLHFKVELSEFYCYSRLQLGRWNDVLSNILAFF